jgi:hypothetical protein
VARILKIILVWASAESVLPRECQSSLPTRKAPIASSRARNCLACPFVRLRSAANNVSSSLPYFNWSRAQGRRISNELIDRGRPGIGRGQDRGSHRFRNYFGQGFVWRPRHDSRRERRSEIVLPGGYDVFLGREVVEEAAFGNVCRR